MAGGFDSFINAAVPWILIIIAVGWVWWKFKEPLSHLAEKIKGMFVSTSDKFQQQEIISRDIVINY